MTVSEIISRKHGQHISTQEMMFVVKEYINERKGVSVDINPLSGHPLRYKIQFSMLQTAFISAQKYFSKGL